MYVNNDGDNDDNDDCGALITSHTLTRGERDPCTLPIFLYRPTGEAGGVFDAAHTFLGEYRTRTHTPRPAGVGIFFIVADVTNERNFGWNFRFFFSSGPRFPLIDT